jgi:hypothetical protein
VVLVSPRFRLEFRLSAPVSPTVVEMPPRVDAAT